MDGDGGLPSAPLFWRCSWTQVLMIHLGVDAALLAPHVPWPLDLHRGKAWLSLVSFTMGGLRPDGWPQALPWLGPHQFVNLRTYVKADGEPAICFMAEWINSLPASVLAGALYGLPTRFARMAPAPLAGQVTHAGQSVVWSGELAPARDEATAVFCHERYVAVTQRGRRSFRVAHAPWRMQPAQVRIQQRGLLDAQGAWAAAAVPQEAWYSPGLDDVTMGRPEAAHPVQPALLAAE